MAVTAAIIGVAVAGATAGYQATESHEAKVDAEHAKNDEIRRQGDLQKQAADKQQQGLVDQANVAARGRQRALAASYGGPGPGVTTNPLGDLGMANTRQKSLLGE